MIELGSLCDIEAVIFFPSLSSTRGIVDTPLRIKLHFPEEQLSCIWSYYQGSNLLSYFSTNQSRRIEKEHMYDWLCYVQVTVVTKIKIYSLVADPQKVA